MWRNSPYILGAALTLVSLPSPAAATGWQHLGAVTRVERMPGGVELKSGKASVRVLAVNESVVRVRLAADGKFPPDFSWAVLSSEAAPPQVTLRDSAEAMEMDTSWLRIRIQKSPLLIAFLDLAGNVLQQDDPQRPMGWNQGQVRAWKSMPPDEYYYGLGDKAGPLNRRNHAYTMWNTDAYGWQESTDPLYKTIPFFLALRRGVAYGVFFDNTYRSDFDFGKESEAFYSFGAEGGELNYYFFYGPHPQRVLEEFTAMVGRTPLPPLWALGYQQCRYSYYPEARVREVARTFREKKIPADAIYLDIDYQDGNRPFTIDRKLFPNFEGMIRDLGEQGFKVVDITDLHIKKEPGYAPYDSGMAVDHFVKGPDGSVYTGVVWPGESVFPEFTRDTTRQWWGTLYKDFVSMGISGFWNDMNEPAVFRRAEKTMPLDTRHRLDA
jgi:alpha-glucosidase